VLKLVLGQGLRRGAHPLLRTLLYEVEPLDPVTFAIVPVILVVVELIACYVPARRAIANDPLETLRWE